MHVPAGLCVSVHVVESEGTARRYWMPFESGIPLPTVRTTFPLESWPSPHAIVLHGFTAGSSAVLYSQSSPGLLLSAALLTAWSPSGGSGVFATPKLQGYMSRRH